jgi:hypothetical protein
MYSFLLYLPPFSFFFLYLTPFRHYVHHTITNAKKNLFLPFCTNMGMEQLASLKPQGLTHNELDQVTICFFISQWDNWSTPQEIKSQEYKQNQIQKQKTSAGPAMVSNPYFSSSNRHGPSLVGWILFESPKCSTNLICIKLNSHFILLQPSLLSIIFFCARPVT